MKCGNTRFPFKYGSKPVNPVMKPYASGQSWSKGSGSVHRCTANRATP